MIQVCNSPLDHIQEFDGHLDVGHFMSDPANIDTLSQADLFREKRALGLDRLKAQWVNDPSFKVFHQDLLEMAQTYPKAQDYLNQCLTANELQEAENPSQRLVYHDPKGSAKYMKSTHVLPQANWIAEDLAPTEEEIAIADDELEFFTKEA